MHYIQKGPIVDQENWYQMRLDSDTALVTISGKQVAMAAAGLKCQGEETLNSEAAARLLQLQREWAKRIKVGIHAGPTSAADLNAK